MIISAAELNKYFGKDATPREIMGHSNINMTLNYYAHIRASSDLKNAGKLVHTDYACLRGWIEALSLL